MPGEVSRGIFLHENNYTAIPGEHILQSLLCVVAKYIAESPTRM